MRRGTLARVLSGSVLLLTLLLPSPAAALTVSGPARVVDAADVTVRLSATDPGGLVSLYRDSYVVRTAYLDSGAALTWKAIGLSTGTHSFRAVVSPRKGRPYAASSGTVTAYGKPAAVTGMYPASGSTCAQKVPVSVRVGANTTLVSLAVNGRAFKTMTVKPGATASFGTVWLAPGRNTLAFTSANLVARTVTTGYLHRLDFPWQTGILIDKSDRRLYWVRDGVLVKSYPVAIGKPSTPTPARVWKVGQKYLTSPTGIYGPRKMRLYKQVRTSTGYAYEFTRYNIHGTNEPWVIGTMASHGCIRLYNSDVLDLYPRVAVGTMVLTRE